MMLYMRPRVWLSVAAAVLTTGCSAAPTKQTQSWPPPQPFEQTGLAGEWDVSDGSLEKTVVLDCHGSGRYDWQDGMVVTTDVRDGYWAGTWHQAGNDREGGFEVLLSPDRRLAEGHWWYSRIGDVYFARGERGGSFSMSRPIGVRTGPDQCRRSPVHEAYGPH
jgi:hypothetical protein